VDHVTSPTAIRLPIERIVDVCAARGVDVLIDGAHAPGMLELDIEAIGAAYYAGNLHKWVGAPPGAAFLWVRPDRQAHVHPTVISHFLDEGLAAEFAWQGTRDVSAWLAAGDARKLASDPRAQSRNGDVGPGDALRGVAGGADEPMGRIDARLDGERVPARCGAPIRRLQVLPASDLRAVPH
jgi:hypothetical protein